MSYEKKRLLAWVRDLYGQYQRQKDGDNVLETENTTKELQLQYATLRLLEEHLPAGGSLRYQIPPALLPYIGVYDTSRDIHARYVLTQDSNEPDVFHAAHKTIDIGNML